MQDAMVVDGQRSAVSRANRESRPSTDDIRSLEDIARRYREAARKLRQDERTRGREEEEEEVEANLWKLVVDVSINIYSHIYAITNMLFKRGRENIVVTELKKWEEYLAGQDRTSHVYDAFTAPLVQSIVYVRARSKDDILEACRRTALSSVRSYNNNISLVPEEEYEASKRSPTAFIPEDWVRIAKGKYRGDVAFITDVNADSRTCKAYYVPRLDFDAKGKTSSRGGRRVQPQQALFDPVVVQSANKRITIVDEQQKIYKYGKKIYTRGLVTEEELSFDKVVQTRVHPTYEEFFLFHKTGILDLEQYHRTLRNIIAHTLKEGTRVTVITGQQKGLKGTVKELVDQDTVRVDFTIDDGATSLTVDIPNLYLKVSDYEIGDVVEVIQGDKLGAKGLVVEVTEGCVVIHDGKSKETV
jgi:transcription elongation factor SPT5